MRVVFAGTPEPAAAVLEALIASEHTVEAVITRPDARRGRGRTLHPSPVAELAARHGIEVLKTSRLSPDDEAGAAVRARLAEINPDCIPVVAYGALVPADLLDCAPHGWVNVHFSMLPQWRGAAPVQAAVASGAKTTGITVFRIDEGLDTGPILAMRETKISDSDTTLTLLDRMAREGAELLVETLTGLDAGTVTPVPQDGEASYAHKITVDDARIDFAQPAEVVDCLIRSVTPSPGAWCMVGDQRVKLGPVRMTHDFPSADGSVDLAPGVMVIEKKRVVVGTASAVVELSTIQFPGKKHVAAADWGRSQNTADGSITIGDHVYPSRSFS